MAPRLLVVVVRLYPPPQRLGPLLKLTHLPAAVLPLIHQPLLRLVGLPPPVTARPHRRELLPIHRRPAIHLPALPLSLVPLPDIHLLVRLEVLLVLPDIHLLVRLEVLLVLPDIHLLVRLEVLLVLPDIHLLVRLEALRVLLSECPLAPLPLVLLVPRVPRPLPGLLQLRLRSNDIKGRSLSTLRTIRSTTSKDSSICMCHH
jgi:hypothetical protein